MGRTPRRRLSARIALAVVVAVAAYAGWQWGHAVFPLVGEGSGIGREETAGMPVGPETAARATARIKEFQDSEEPELRLESAEVSSLLRYSVPEMLPGGVVEPSVSFAGERIELHAGVLPGHIPDLPRLGVVAGLLPDTVDVFVVGSLLPSNEDGTLLLIEGVEFHGWPVPPKSLPQFLAEVGLASPREAPGSTVLLPPVRGLKGAYVEDGRLVVVRARQPGGRGGTGGRRSGAAGRDSRNVERALSAERR